MQPIALNTKVIADLINDWVNVKSQRSFFKLTENLEQFHQVYIDKNESGSKWLDEFREIRDSINDQNIKRIFDDLIGPRNIKYFPVTLTQLENYFFEVTSQTPDKIGISNSTAILDELMFYDLSKFNSNEYDSDCRLFRLPKTITFTPGKELKNYYFLKPYLQIAKKLEFCDPFLFNNFVYDDDYTFVRGVIQNCPKLSELEIYCTPSNTNPLQKKFKKFIENYNKNITFSYFKTYNSSKKNKNVNHDRFIIVDTNKISIRFTTSFNNLRKTSSGGFKAKDSFLIEFSSGRKYYD
ncbi:MAG TPA: hypothetical protein PKA80_13285 [Ignavibacteriaceae bacterium]|nr:hypothetical protein [Ignavibacteriaceae bacterium]